MQAKSNIKTKSQLPEMSSVKAFLAEESTSSESMNGLFRLFSEARTTVEEPLVIVFTGKTFDSGRAAGKK